MSIIKHINAAFAVSTGRRSEVRVGSTHYHREEQWDGPSRAYPEITALDPEARAMFGRVSEKLGLGDGEGPSGEILIVHRSAPNWSWRAFALWRRQGRLQIQVRLRKPWASRRNARTACLAVIDSGGSKIRAIRAYARTLLGIGEPASAL